MSDKSFKCPGCGGEMHYQAGTELQKCQYCGFELEIPENEEQIRELDFQSFINAHVEDDDKEEIKTVDCQACAAQVTLAENISGDECPYCGSTVLTEGAVAEHLRPKSLLPFKVEQKRAGELFKSWINGLWFAPNELKERSKLVEKISGMYVPYWTYDSNTVSHYHGQRGDDYWVTETYTTTVNGKSETRTRQVRKTRWTSVSGMVFDQFDDILVPATTSLPDKKINELEPWDLENIVPYSEEFLTGYRVENYQVSLEDGFHIAEGVMDEEIEKSIKRDIGGDHQRITSFKTQYNDVTFKHILLPVWLSSYRYKDNVYQFLVNGRTGEVQGERPYSAVKIACAVISAIAVVTGIILAVQS